MYAAVSAAWKKAISKRNFPLGAATAVGSYQVVQLNGVHTLVDTRDDFLGDSSSIDVLGVEAVTQSRNTGSDLIELHAFLASIYEISVSVRV